MSEPFSDAWIQAAAETAPASLLEAVGAAIVTFSATGGPEGDAVSTWIIADGELHASATYRDDAQVHFALAWNDTMAVLRCDLEASVVYMRGTLKTSGDMDVALRVLKATASPAFKEWRVRLFA